MHVCRRGIGFCTKSILIGRVQIYHVRVLSARAREDSRHIKRACQHNSGIFLITKHDLASNKNSTKTVSFIRCMFTTIRTKSVLWKLNHYFFPGVSSISRNRMEHAGHSIGTFANGQCFPWMLKRIPECQYLPRDIEIEKYFYKNITRPIIGPTTRIFPLVLTTPGNFTARKFVSRSFRRPDERTYGKSKQDRRLREFNYEQTNKFTCVSSAGVFYVGTY